MENYFMKRELLLSILEKNSSIEKKHRLTKNQEKKP